MKNIFKFRAWAPTRKVGVLQKGRFYLWAKPFGWAWGKCPAEIRQYLPCSGKVAERCAFANRIPVKKLRYDPAGKNFYYKKKCVGSAKYYDYLYCGENEDRVRSTGILVNFIPEQGPKVKR